MQPYEVAFWGGFGVLLVAVSHPFFRDAVYTWTENQTRRKWMPVALSSVLGMGASVLIGWACSTAEVPSGGNDMSYGIGIRVSF